MENWKIIHHSYQVSDQGRVMNSTSGLILKGGVDGSGYHTISIHNKTIKTHRLVATNFCDNPKGKPQVNHKNGIKTDNRAVNLEWVTRSENSIHAYQTGLQKSQKGSNHGMSKLTEDQIQIIRTKCVNMKRCEVAKLFGISPAMITLIRQGKYWRHV